MNNLSIAFIMILVSFNGAREQNHTIQETKSVVTIDTQQSVIRWKGTKMLHTGSHEGTIRFQSGELELSGNEIQGGQFVVDMSTIEITDIPEHESVPRNNLKKHLEADFEIRRFPTASMVLLKSTSPDSKQLCAKLTIKASTRELCFEAIRTNAKTWTCKLIILRNDFAIGEQGSWLEKRLVDQEIELSVELRVQ
jgi:hypothetical protein